MRRLTLLLILVCLAIPAAAAAQDNPFGPLPPSQQVTPAPTAAPTPADQGSVSRGLLFGIAGAVAIVFIGIGWYITRDARAHLTDEDRRLLEGRPVQTRADADAQRTKAAKSKARAAGKRQRQARKAQRRR
jgi:hypothetical protein